MSCRLTYLTFLFLIPTIGAADSGIWDCEQAEGNDEWICGSAEEQEPSKAPVAHSPERKMKKTVTAKKKSPARMPLAQPKPVALPPPVQAAKSRGWNCAADDETQTWNCNLTGSDPKGKARVMPEKRRGIALLKPTFDHEQEQTFEELQSRLKYDPWANCSTTLGAPPDFVSDKDLRIKAPMNIDADYSEVFDNEVTGFFGNVDITRADQNLTSDTVHYDTVSQTLDAQGNVYYSEDQVSLFSDTLMLNLGTDEARLREALFITPSVPIRGEAKVVYRDSKTLSRYTDAAFTSCKPGNQDWILHAGNLKINKLSGQGSAKNAWLEFKGVPVIYTPYISFPIDNRRLTGLLTPSFGVSDKSGFDVSVPYYWNIAPNYDATFRPRYLSKRGLMLAADFRHLSSFSRSALSFEVLPEDNLVKESRYLGSFKNSMIFTPNLSSVIDANYVSDKDYFNDLGNGISFSDTRFLRSYAGINYRRQGISFSTLADNYQIVDRTILPVQKPYRRLPQVKLDLNHEFDFMPLALAMESEYVNFDHNNLVSGDRFNVKPSISFPVETAGAYVTPKFALQHTQYFLTDPNTGVSTDINRTLPIVSLDSGFFLEKNFNMADGSYIHTIEPRLFYLYIPNKDQSNIPIFDSAEYDFNFYSLFRDNRFSGADRVQDANQLTTAITTRIINAKTGQESFKFSLGEIFYFRDREVVLNQLANSAPVPVNPGFINSTTNSFSNLIAELNTRLTDNLSLSSGMQWDHSSNRLNRSEVVLHYVNNREQIFNIGYRYRRDFLEQADISFRWPLFDNWYAIGRWQYSLFHNSSIESFAGIEKESCCWRFRIIGRRYINTIIAPDGNAILDASGESQVGIFAQIELKGLSAFGDKLDEFFEKNIYGYRKPQ